VWGHRIRVLAVVGAAAMVLPSQVWAHGSGSPTATSFVARLREVPAGVKARIVDGDQRLWLRVQPGRTVTVLGFQGEPYLRFSSAGVEVNERSLAFYLNRSRPRAIPHGLDALASPDWHRVASGPSYSWHEDRLHSLAAAARRPGSALVGTWTIPVLEQGKRLQLLGTLRYSPDPSPLWFWPVAVVLLSLPALLRLRRGDLDRAALIMLSAVTLAALVLARVGRELYGRPDVSARSGLSLLLTCAVALLLAAGLTSSEWRTVAALLIGSAGVYEGIALLGTFLRGHVLAALPADVERAAAVACLSCGAALLIVVLVDRSTSPPGRARSA